MMTRGTARATAATRTHFLRQMAATRIRKRMDLDLDRDNPVMPEVKGQLALQAIQEGGPILVQK